MIPSIILSNWYRFHPQDSWGWRFAWLSWIHRVYYSPPILDCAWRDLLKLVIVLSVLQSSQRLLDTFVLGLGKWCCDWTNPCCWDLWWSDRGWRWWYYDHHHRIFHWLDPAFDDIGGWDRGWLGFWTCFMVSWCLILSVYGNCEILYFRIWSFPGQRVPICDWLRYWANFPSAIMSTFRACLTIMSTLCTSINKYAI